MTVAVFDGIEAVGGSLSSNLDTPCIVLDSARHAGPPPLELGRRRLKQLLQRAIRRRPSKAEAVPEIGENPLQGHAMCQACRRGLCVNVFKRLLESATETLEVASHGAELALQPASSVAAQSTP